MAIKLFSGSTSATKVRQEALTETGPMWETLRSTWTCFFCLFRCAEHRLSCGHSMCDSCVNSLGHQVLTSEDLFRVSYCYLCCAATSLVAKIKPPTAGVRMLAIDGGGIYGVIPLEFLQLLQRDLGPRIKIQELFDIVFGTSSGRYCTPISIENLTQILGGLSVLGLFSKNWDVFTCASKFTSLSRQVFHQVRKRPWRVFSKVKTAVMCLITDGHYDGQALERVLQQNFGHNTLMFGVDTPTVSGTKIAVTATAVNDASACVLSNYNGPENRPEDCGKRC